MPQPKDFAEGWDPYKTDPAYVLAKQPEHPAPYADDGYADADQQEVPHVATDQRPERVVRKDAKEPSNSTHRERSMFKTLFDFFIPPLNDHPESVRRWRISVGLSLLVLFMNLTLSYGWYQAFGFNGFAYATTVNKINIKLLQRDIFETRTSQCKATTNESRQFYGKRLVELLGEYQEEARKDYPLPSCRELGSIDE